MKEVLYKEFKKSVKDLGFICKEREFEMVVSYHSPAFGGDFVLLVVEKGRRYKFEILDPEKVTIELFELVYELAKTPVNERVRLLYVAKNPSGEYLQHFEIQDDFDFDSDSEFVAKRVEMKFGRVGAYRFGEKQKNMIEKIIPLEFIQIEG